MRMLSFQTRQKSTVIPKQRVRRELIWTSSRLCKHSLTPALAHTHVKGHDFPLHPSSKIGFTTQLRLNLSFLLTQKGPTQTKKPSTNLNWCWFESSLPRSKEDCPACFSFMQVMIKLCLMIGSHLFYRGKIPTRGKEEGNSMISCMTLQASCSYFPS